MKKLLFVLFLISPFLVIGQWSLSAEFVLDPFPSNANRGFEQLHQNTDDDRTIYKEINLAVNYSLPKLLTLRLGVSALDSKFANGSTPYHQDDVIDGFPSQFQNITLRHQSRIKTYSVFGGLQFDMDRLHFIPQVHYALGRFKDSAIVGSEYSSFTGLTQQTFYDVKYESVSFIKADFSIAYDLLVAKKGTIAIVFKYMRDFSNDERFVVMDFDPEVREMIENFPGTGYYDIDQFLQGGPLYYNQEFWGVGLRMIYNLGD